MAFHVLAQLTGRYHKVCNLSVVSGKWPGLFSFVRSLGQRDSESSQTAVVLIIGRL